MLCEKDKTSISAPAYYLDFKCIADKCRHSCCVDWEIAVDEGTLARYEGIEYIADTVQECDDGACFRLSSEGRCPHLNESGLCDLIIRHGEAMLPEICKNHPRFFNRVGEEIEAGLGIVCEEACRIILESDAPFSLIRIEVSAPDLPEAVLDTRKQRDEIISIIEARDISLEERISTLKEKYKIVDIHTSDEWLDIFLNLEILDTGWAERLGKAKGKSYANAHDFDECFLHLLEYFIYRHVSAAESAENLRARLGFAILSLDMIRHLFSCEDEQTSETLAELARLYSSEIEYSEENTAELIFELESTL